METTSSTPAYRIETKPAVEFGAPVVLYAAVFPSGYHTVWYADVNRAIAAGNRRAALKVGA